MSEKFCKTVAEYTGQRFGVRLDETRLVGCGEKPFIREVVEKYHDTVIVAPIDIHDKLYLMREYHYAVDDTILKFPCGDKAENGDIYITALHILDEYFGFKGNYGMLVNVGSYYPAPDYNSEKTTMIVAYGLIPKRDDEMGSYTTRISYEELCNFEKTPLADLRTLAFLPRLKSFFTN